jgi:hypothetical protein
MRDYDMLYRSKLERLLELNEHERVTWSGPAPPTPLEDTARRAPAGAAARPLSARAR